LNGLMMASTFFMIPSFDHDAEKEWDSLHS